MAFGVYVRGTHSWGSRSSSTTINAWGSSALSPSTSDGGTGSPSCLTGRPSSGGSGTRPSTAGSDKSCELAPNAWGSNSRPSSACGTLTSSQTLVTSTRPRSAETRPSSSHLSRFAEPNCDNSSAWNRPETAEKLVTYKYCQGCVCVFFWCALTSILTNMLSNFLYCLSRTYISVGACSLRVLFHDVLLQLPILSFLLTINFRELHPLRLMGSQ